MEPGNSYRGCHVLRSTIGRAATRSHGLDQFWPRMARSSYSYHHVLGKAPRRKTGSTRRPVTARAPAERQRSFSQHFALLLSKPQGCQARLYRSCSWCCAQPPTCTFPNHLFRASSTEKLAKVVDLKQWIPLTW